MLTYTINLILRSPNIISGIIAMFFPTENNPLSKHDILFFKRKGFETNNLRTTG